MNSVYDQIHLEQHHLSLLIETQNVVAHAASPAAFHFMFVSEELLASEASSIVQLTVGQHA